MIKNALKNFFKNIISVFIPMGIVYLVLLIAVFTLVGGLARYAGTMLGDVMKLIQTSSESSSASVNAFFAYSADELTKAWNGNLWSFFRTIFETRWLQNTVIGFFRTLSQSTEGFEEQITGIVRTFSGNMTALISGVVSLSVLGIVAANFVTRIAVRRRTAKRGVRKFFLAHTIVPVVETLLLIGFGLLLATVKYYTLIALPAFLLISVSIALTSSWIIHRDKTLKWKDVVTVKNVFMHLAAVGIILLIDLVLAVVLFLIDPLLAILIMIPFILYSLNIADVNTDAIVCKLIEEKQKAAEASASEPAPAEEKAEPAPTEQEEKPAPAEEKAEPAPAEREEKPAPAEEKAEPAPAEEKAEPAPAEREEKTPPAEE